MERRVVYVALAGNLLVTATKLAAALWTGSSAMLGEAVHSFVDTGNGLPLLHGMHRAGRRPEAEHLLAALGTYAAASLKLPALDGARAC